MLQEIELKLTANQEVINSIKQELSHFHVVNQTQVFSRNIYFDTADLFFAKHKMGLRVREEQQQYTMTLKTAGKNQGALHIRPEYNIRLTQFAPDMAQFSAYPELQLDRDYHSLQTALRPIFATDFQREYYLLEMGNGTQLEIALDQGKITANDKEEPISEIEIELKHGTVNDVLYFVQNLLFLDGMRLGQESKAERGYRLAGTVSTISKVTIDAWRNLLENSYPTTPSKVLALYQFELRLLKYLEQLKRCDLAQEQQCVTELIGLFFNLYQYSSHEEQLFQLAATELAAQGNQIDTAIVADLQEKDRIIYQQIRQIIARHVEHQDPIKAIQQLFDLTSQGQYLQKMIHLLKLTLK